MPRATYSYQVDFAGTLWQNDLISRGLAAQDEPANSDITAYVLDSTLTGGRQSELQPFGVGRMSLKLDNSDYRFMPDITTGPYGTTWDTGVAIRALADGTVIFFGFIDSIIPQADDNNQSVTIECVDLMDKLARASVTSGLHQQVTTGQLVQRLIADGLNWRLDWTDIATGQDSVPYAWWTNANLLDAIQGVERSEGGFFFVAGNGYPTFHDKYTRILLSTSGGVVGDAQVQESALRRTLGDVANDIRVQAHPRYVKQAGVRVWQLNGVTLFGANETKEFQAEYSDPETKQRVPAINIIPPMSGVDYGANSTSNGGQIVSTTMVTAGTGYSVNKPPVITVTGGGGSGAILEAVVATGGLSRIVVTNSGDYGDHGTPPTITISGGGGTGATAVAVMGSGDDVGQDFRRVVAVNITNPGTGYTSNPTVTFSGGGGLGGATASAFANILGSIATINISNGGGGYTTAPTLTFEASPSGGTLAEATATIVVGSDRTSDLNIVTNFQNFGQVARIRVSNTAATPLYLIYLRLRGDPLVSPDVSPQIATDGPSQNKYQKRTLEIDQPWQQDIIEAEVYAKFLIDKFANPRSKPSVGLVNRNATDLALMLGYGLNDYMLTTLGRYGLASVVGFIGGYDVAISDGGLTHRTTWYLEQAGNFSRNFFGSLVLDLRPDTGLTVDNTSFTGTGTVTQSLTTVTGTGTLFKSEVVVGDQLTGTEFVLTTTVIAIASDTVLTVDTSTTVISTTFQVVPQANVSDRISTQADQSGLGNNATQSGTKRPARKLSVQNGLPMLLYDGENDQLNVFPVGVSTSAVNVPFTAIMVLRALNPSDYQAFLRLSSTGGATPYHDMGTTNGTSLYYSSRQGTSGPNSTSGGAVDSGIHILEYIYDGTYMTIVSDGTTQAGPTSLAAGTAVFNAAEIGGSEYSTDPLWSNMYLGDVMFYTKALLSTQRTALRLFLADRWAIGLTTTLIHDTFTDTDGTLLPAHTISPTNTPAVSWVVASGTDANVTIQSNRAQSTAITIEFRTVNAGVSNVTITATLRVAGTGAGLIDCIVARYTDTSNFWMLVLYNTEFSIYEVTGGVITQRDTEATVWSLNTNYEFSFVLSGNSITGTYDGAHELLYTSSSHQTVTKHGIRTVAAGGNEQMVDNFKVTTP